MSPPSSLFLPAALAATFMELLDVTIVHVAAPSIRSDLGSGPGAVELVVAGYVLSYACTLICAARLGDRFGYRRLFVIGMVVFTAASAVCALAPNTQVLIGARVVQGFGGALANPQVLSMAQITYAGAGLGRFFQLYGATMGVASVAGPVLGGLLVTADLGGLGWRLIFLVNVPIGVAVLAASGALPAARGAAGRIDRLGAALVSTGLALLVLPLALGQEQGWPSWTWGCLAGSAVVLAAFAVAQTRRGRAGLETLLHPSLVRDRSAVSGLAVVFLFYVGISSFSYFFSIHLQAHGHTALMAGLTFAPFAVAAIAGSQASASLARRHGHRLLTASGVALAVVMAVLAALVAGTGVGDSPGALAVPLLAGGFAFGLFTAAGFSIVLGNVAPEAVGSASGLLPTVLNLGGAFGVTAAGALFIGAGGFASALVLDTAAFALAAVAAGSLPRPTTSAQPEPLAATSKGSHP